MRANVWLLLTASRKVGKKLIHGEGPSFELLPHLVGNFISAEMHVCEVRGVSQD
jgi:hypothetical protein